LYKNSARTFEELAEVLNVSKSTVHFVYTQWKRLKKEGKWIPHELSELAIQNCLTICTLLLSRYKKKRTYYDNLKCKKLWV